MNKNNAIDDEDDDDDDDVPTLIPYNQVDVNSNNNNNNDKYNQTGDIFVPNIGTKSEANVATVAESDWLPESKSQEQQPSSSTSFTSSKPCPVTILSGFLGSGKSTLIQYILSSPDHGRRIAVIENEFGDSTNNTSSSATTNQNISKTTTSKTSLSNAVSIESMIVRDGISSSNNNNNIQEFIELPNGCICCTVKDSLIVTLEQLLKKKKKNTIDYIIIECSGMANPGPIASIFWLDDALESQLVLDGIITMVDITNIQQQINTTIEASQQIAYADRILLNKIDLIQTNNTSSIQQCMDLIQNINPTATIRTTSYAQVPDIDWIINTQCFNIDHAQSTFMKMIESTKTKTTTTNQFLNEMTSCNDCTVNINNIKVESDTNITNSNNTKHAHTNAVTTITLQVPGYLDLQKVHSWLAHILWPNQDEHESILRTKMEIEQQQRNSDDNVAVRPETNQQQQHIFRMKGILSIGTFDINEDHVNDDDNNKYLQKVLLSDTINNNDMESFTKPIMLYADQRRYIVQGVYDLWDIHPCTNEELYWENNDERISTMIIIGRYLNRNELQDGFNACTIAYS